MAVESPASPAEAAPAPCSPSATVVVSRLAPTTSEATLRDFFSFCGTITALELAGGAASIAFASATSAKTATMLTGASLDGEKIRVRFAWDKSADDSSDDADADADAENKASENSRNAFFLANLIATGIITYEQLVKRTTELDQQYGLSNNFKLIVAQAIKEVDKLEDRLHVREKTEGLVSSLNEQMKKYNVQETIDRVKATALAVGSAAIQTYPGEQFVSLVAQFKARIAEGIDEGFKLAEEKRKLGHGEVVEEAEPVVAE